jgi:hypothetical protein
MSKKKNTLKDLDEFLKQQAAVLVQPASLSDQIEEPAPEKKPTPSPKLVPQADGEVSVDSILQDLRLLSLQEGQAFRRKFYDLIVRSMEAQPHSEPQDKMLINTALYLKSGDSWKEAIRNYWRNKSH